MKDKGPGPDTHADDEMLNDRVSIDLLEEAIGKDSPKIIEKYHNSCLLLGWGTPTEPVHVVVALGTTDRDYDTPVLVTVYRPDQDPRKRWKDNYAKRKKKIFRCIF